MHKTKPIYLLFFTLLQLTLFAQNNSSHCIVYQESIGSPLADLSSINWIEGHWQGKAFGGTTEEIWTPPLGGSMMCVFKLVMDNQVKFYEIVTIVEENESLILRLKHFHKDLKGWEEKNKTINFKLVKITEEKVYFDGFTFERVNDNEMNVYVVIEEGKEKTEAKFNYQRVQK